MKEQVPSNTIGIIACIDAWIIVFFVFIVFIKKVYTIIMCLYYIDLLYNVICYTISHSIVIYYIPIRV